MGALPTIVLGLLLVGWCFAGSPAFADKRVALVIGNGSYDKVPRLGNPANDAALMAETFRSAGFDGVDLRRDLKVSDMRRALRDFVDKASDADIAVVYYAGHGIEVDGINYLVPVDAILDRDRDVHDEALSLERVLVAVEPAKKLRLVILDACRDNPFTRSMKRTLASRAVGRGLARVEPTNPNTLIAFASKAGSTASDGDGRHSPFTTALVNHVTKPGLDLRKAFGYVRDDVLKSTGNRQEPYLYGSLGVDDLALVPAKPAAASGPQADPQTAVRRDYELALQLGTRDGWEAFVSQYLQGFYVNLAKGQLKKIAAEEARLAAVEKARLAEQEKARLAAEGAKQAEQAKAAAAAKAAEEARIAAEKAKQIEQEKAAAAEKARLAEQEKVRLAQEKARLAEEEKLRLAAEKAKRIEQEKAAAAEKARLAEEEKARIAAEKAKRAEEEKAAAAERARIAAEKAAEEKKQKLAAVVPTEKPEQPAIDLPRALQAELRRVGCNTGTIDGNWNAASQKALDLFNKYAGMKLDVKTASVDALDVVKGKTGRICPLICERGFRAEGDRCVELHCSGGYRVNDNNECERITQPKKPVATREDSPRRDGQRKQTESTPPKPQATGQIICNSGGCRPVRKGCRLAPRAGFVAGGMPQIGGTTVEVCD